MNDTVVTPQLVSTAVTTALLGLGVGAAVTFFGLLYWEHSDHAKVFRIVDTERISSEVRETKQACLASQATLSARMDAIANNFASVKSASALPEKLENKVNPALKQDTIDFTDMSVQLYYRDTQAQRAIEISQLLEKHNARVVREEIKRGGENLLPNKIYFSNNVYGAAANNMKQLLTNWGVKAIGPMGKSRGKKSQIHFVLYVN